MSTTEGNESLSKNVSELEREKVVRESKTE
jgi:hypothetical protein